MYLNNAKVLWKAYNHKEPDKIDLLDVNQEKSYFLYRVHSGDEVSYVIGMLINHLGVDSMIFVFAATQEEAINIFGDAFDKDVFSKDPISSSE